MDPFDEEFSIQCNGGGIKTILEEAGIPALTESSGPDEIESAVRKLVKRVDCLDAVAQGVCRAGLLNKLKQIKFQGTGDFVKTLFTRKTKTENKLGDFLKTVEPHPYEVEGADLLNEIRGILNRYLVLPESADVAVTLWILFAWGHDCFSHSPILLFQSPTKRCGKTTAMEILTNLLPRSLSASNISTAALFRSVEAFRPTLIIDEVDTFLNVNEEIGGILNSGHKRAGAFVLRVEGDDHEPRRFSTWCPKVLAGIGKRRDTLEDRAIIIAMKRKAPGERVEKFRLTPDLQDQLFIIQQKSARWTQDTLESLKEADPKIPGILNDRAGDNWEPLFIIADLCGGDWPSLARSAALKISGEGTQEDDSAGIQLLQAIQNYFKEQDSDQVSSDQLEKYLHGLEGTPWPDWRHGKPISKTGIARLLKPYGIKPKRFWTGANERGYLQADFEETFSRYLSSPGIETTDPTEPFKHNGLDDFRNDRKSDSGRMEKTHKPLQTNEPVGSVTLKPPDGEKKEKVPAQADFLEDIF